MTGPAARLVEACQGLGLDVGVQTAAWLAALLDRIALEPQNLTSVDLVDGVERHLLDSLSALALPSVRRATSLVDLGSGGGFPGIPLASNCPECAVTLVESERRKADWLARVSADLPNVRVVPDRGEHLAQIEREARDVVTARALAELPVVLELAAPLVRVGGTVVAWSGRRDAAEEARAAEAGAILGLEPVAPHRVPVAGAERWLHAYRKITPTSDRFPRRAGRATKRPLA